MNELTKPFVSSVRTILYCTLPCCFFYFAKKILSSKAIYSYKIHIAYNL